MPADTPLGKRPAILIAGVLVGAGLLLPWWRNHGLLRDFYDYGNIMAGVGRIQLGDRPYVDFLTPIQTLQFYIGVLAERAWGARYLSLTYAGAVFTIGAFATFAALLIRPLGGWLAILVSAAIVAASSAQHTMVWYNAMGVTWLAIAMWLSGRYSESGARQGAAVALVWAALWLGGMTKATYQLAAIAFVVVFTLRRGVTRQMSWKKVAGLLVGSLVFATVVPVATELLLTGASFEQWKKNVFHLALARTELLKPIATWAFYWHTPHDYHRPLYLPFVGAWGMALTIAVGAAAALRLKARCSSRCEWLFLLAAFSGAAACGLAFLALHLEIAYLSGAAWLVLGTGLVLVFVPRESSRSNRVARGALALGAITLLIPAWSSAWSGARAIWGHVPLVRSELVLADDLPPSFSYLRGLRILPEWHHSLRSLSEFQAAMAAEGFGPECFYFIHGTEWLVRAMPEARHAGLPLWLQYGTTYTAEELPLIARTLEREGDVEIIVSHHAWNNWPDALRPVVEHRYRPVFAGSAFETIRLRAEFARPLTAPLWFAAHTRSNLHAGEMSATGGRLEMYDRMAGWFVGATESTQLTLNFGLYRLGGELVAELSPDNPSGSAKVTFRIRRTEGDAAGQLLWDENVVLTSDQPTIRRPFAISPGGGHVSLELELPPGESAIAGWTNLQTQHSAGSLHAPRPVHGNLAPARLDAAGIEALMGDGSARPADVVSFGTVPIIEPVFKGGVAVGAPGEIWLRLDEPRGRVSGAFRIGKASGAGSLKFAVVYYKSGRFDVMHDAILSYGDESETNAGGRFEVGVPEAVGWIGLVTTPVAGEATGVQVEWSDVTLR